MSSVIEELNRDRAYAARHKMRELEDSILLERSRLKELKDKYPNHKLLGREDEIGMRLFRCSSSVKVLENLLLREIQSVKILESRNYQYPWR